MFLYKRNLRQCHAHIFQHAENVTQNLYIISHILIAPVRHHNGK